LGYAIAKIGLPAIVKPVNGTGSIGVSLVRTKAEAVDALSVLLSVTMNERGQSVPSSALLMSYVEGDEFSVEIIDGKVMGVTQKHLGPLPFFVETGHDYPAPVSDELYGRIGTEAQRAVKALGHSSGPAHVEVRVNTNGITIIEVNPRLAGGSIPRLMHYATGVDPIAAVIESACGRHPEIQSSSSNFGSLRFIVPSTNGLFQPPCQSAELAEKFGLTEVSYYHKTPITFQRRNDFRDRLGHVIAVDSDPVAAAHRAEAAIAFICKS